MDFFRYSLFVFLYVNCGAGIKIPDTPLGHRIKSISRTLGEFRGFVLALHKTNVILMYVKCLTLVYLWCKCM